MRFLPLAFLCLASAALAQAPKDAPIRKGLNEIDIPEGKYYLEAPDNYDPKKGAPLLVFLHGKTPDPKADNAKPQMSNDFVMRMKREGYIAVAPVMPPEHRPHWFENGDSLVFVDAVMVDVNRKLNVTYALCSGFSAGANYTLYWGDSAKSHHFFVGFFVMAGGGAVDKMFPDEHKKRPIWLGCGDADMDDYDDKMKTTGGARKTIQEMKDAGWECGYDEIPKVGHVMDKKMVDKAMEWHAKYLATYQAIGAIDRAKNLKGAEALRLLEPVAKSKAIDYWKKNAEAAAKSLADEAKKAIDEALALGDSAKASDALNKLATEYKDTSVYPLVRDALGKLNVKK